MNMHTQYNKERNSATEKKKKNSALTDDFSRRQQKKWSNVVSYIQHPN